MVFIIDEGSVFNAPIEKVWKLNMSEGNHSHPSVRNYSTTMEGEHPILSYESPGPNGSWMKNKVRLTLLPPVGIVFESIEGPMTGSKSMQFYTPRGNETAVTVVGNWVAGDLPEAQLKPAVLGFLDSVFKEDQANLARMSE